MYSINYKFILLFSFLLEVFISVGFSNNIYFFFVFFLLLYIFSNNFNLDYHYELKINLNLLENNLKFNIMLIINLISLNIFSSNFLLFIGNSLSTLSYHFLNKFYHKYYIINSLSNLLK